MIKIKCIIFDFGGVISNPQIETYVSKMIKLTGIEKSIYMDEYRKHRNEYDRGTISGREYWSRIISDAHKTLESETINKLIEYDVKSWTSINKETKDYIHILIKKNVKIAILSNINFDTIQYLEKHQKWISELKHKIFSCELKALKPETTIYKNCLSEVGLEPRDCLFIDDSNKNVQAAHDLGINVLLFESSKKMINEIELKYSY